MDVMEKTNSLLVCIPISTTISYTSDQIARDTSIRSRHVIAIEVEDQHQLVDTFVSTYDYYYLCRIDLNHNVIVG